jgi:hypothetical protein
MEGGARDGQFFGQIFLFLLVHKSWHAGACEPLCGRAGYLCCTHLENTCTGGGGQSCDSLPLFLIYLKRIKNEVLKTSPAFTIPNV